MKDIKKYLLLVLTFATSGVLSAHVETEVLTEEEALIGDSTDDDVLEDAEARMLFLQDELRKRRILASWRERMLAALPFYNSDNPRVQELTSLKEAEWALREKILKRQRKNRLQLFINRHEQILRFAAIAAILGLAGGLTVRKIWDKTEKNRNAYPQPPAPAVL